MKIARNHLIYALLTFSISFVCYGAEPLKVSLWSGPAPGTEGLKDKSASVDRRGSEERKNRFIRNVVKPLMTIYLPEKKKSNGAAVIICPGGGYTGLAVDKEGHDVARRLNEDGFAGIVLRYRLPRVDLSKSQKPWPLQDVQRAIRTIRYQSPKLGINPHRIGVMGFSAGGHLASSAGTHFDDGESGAKDPVRRISCRPDFMILVYPVISMKKEVGHTGSRRNLLGPNPSKQKIELFSNEYQVTHRTPPAFLVHAKDDHVKVENSIRFAEALREAKVQVHLELYEKGGHGFGLGVRGGEVATWPDRCLNWLNKKVLKGIPSAGRWREDIASFQKADREKPPPVGGVLFAGSSSIRKWKLNRYFPELKTINRGFGGSFISDSVVFSSRIVLPYKPRCIVMYAGDNDIAAGKSPERVLRDFKTFARIVHASLRQTEILFISVKPSISRWHLAGKMSRANRMIKNYTAKKSFLKYIDIYSPMIGKNGKPRKELFLSDGLHLNRKGYELWTSRVLAALKDRPGNSEEGPPGRAE